MLTFDIQLYANAVAHGREGSRLFDYIDSVNNSAVTFEEHAKFDPSEDNLFMFYDINGKPYQMTMDAGRTARAAVQETCENISILVEFKDLCAFAAKGR